VDEARRASVAAAAQGVLDARASYPESTLADLYDPLTMPPELTKAHAKLDALVDKPFDKPFDKLRASSTVAFSPPTPTACASLRALRGLGELACLWTRRPRRIFWRHQGSQSPVFPW
jgi:hypothetical protein